MAKGAKCNGTPCLRPSWEPHSWSHFWWGDSSEWPHSFYLDFQGMGLGVIISLSTYQILDPWPPPWDGLGTQSHQHSGPSEPSHGRGSAVKPQAIRAHMSQGKPRMWGAQPQLTEVQATYHHGHSTITLWAVCQHASRGLPLPDLTWPDVMEYGKDTTLMVLIPRDSIWTEARIYIHTWRTASVHRKKRQCLLEYRALSCLSSILPLVCVAGVKCECTGERTLLRVGNYQAKESHWSITSLVLGPPIPPRILCLLTQLKGVILEPPDMPKKTGPTLRT